MSLTKRSGFWVVLFIVGIVALFIGSQVWLQHAATPSAGVAVTIEVNSLAGSPAAKDSFLQDRGPGPWAPFVELPGSIVNFTEEPRIEPFPLPAGFSLEAWLAEAYPGAAAEIGESKDFESAPIGGASGAEAGPGVVGRTTAVLLRRADGSLDPLWFTRFGVVGEPHNAPVIAGRTWGVVSRLRAGPYVRPTAWTVSARDFLDFRMNFFLRKEIGFSVEILVDLAEREEGAEYWLDRVPAGATTLPEGAVPAPASIPSVTEPR